MKKAIIIIIVFVFSILNTFAQIRTFEKAQQKSNTNRNILATQQNNKIVISAFPINNGKVSATPISIPAPNNTPIQLKAYSNISTYSNNPSNNNFIKGCALVAFKNKTLTVRVYHKLSNINAPVYVGGWLYDKHNNALDVAYIPKVVSNNNLNYTDVLLKFRTLPITSEYIDVMLIMNKKTLAKKRYQLIFQWKENPTITIHKAKDIDYGAIAKIIQKDPNNFTKYVPDLEITAIKSINNQMKVIDFNKSCNNPNKLIFISNIGEKTSANFQIIIGYYILINNTFNKYIEYKQIPQKSLLAGKQTYINIKLPNHLSNIVVKIKYYGKETNGEINLKNNILTKKCKN